VSLAGLSSRDDREAVFYPALGSADQQGRALHEPPPAGGPALSVTIAFWLSPASNEPPTFFNPLLAQVQQVTSRRIMNRKFFLVTVDPHIIRSPLRPFRPSCLTSNCGTFSWRMDHRARTNLLHQDQSVHMCYTVICTPHEHFFPFSFSFFLFLLAWIGGLMAAGTIRASCVSQVDMQIVTLFAPEFHTRAHHA